MGYLENKPQKQVEMVMDLMRRAGWDNSLNKNGYPKSEAAFDSDAQILHREVLVQLAREKAAD